MTKLRRPITGIALMAVLALSPATLAAATAVPVGDIILLGTIERSGRRLLSDATLFEGDVLRTRTRSGGVMRVGRGRIELGVSTDVAIESAQPLRLLVRAGSIAFNFPAGTDFVIVTPQLEIRPGPDLEAVSGVIAALPEDDQDIVQTRNGLLDVLERQEHGALRRVEGGQLLVASLVPTFSIPVAEPSFALPQAQTQIAQFQAVEGDVFLTRFQTTLRNRVDAPGVPLFSGDEVTTLQGKADVLFTDQSLITLDVGTTVVIEEQQQPTGILRSISQGLGSLWFTYSRWSAPRPS